MGTAYCSLELDFQLVQEITKGIIVSLERPKKASKAINSTKTTLTLKFISIYIKLLLILITLTLEKAFSSSKESFGDIKETIYMFSLT